MSERRITWPEVKVAYEKMDHRSCRSYPFFPHEKKKQEAVVSDSMREYPREPNVEAVPKSTLPDGLELWGLWDGGDWLRENGRPIVYGTRLEAQRHPSYMKFEARRMHPHEEQPQEPQSVEHKPHWHDAWLRLCAKHLIPSRIFELAVMGETKTEEEAKHLRECGMCGRFYEAYLETVEPPEEPQHPLLAAINQLAMIANSQGSQRVRDEIDQCRQLAEPVLAQLAALKAYNAEMRALLESSRNMIQKLGYPEMARLIADLLARTGGGE